MAKRRTPDPDPAPPRELLEQLGERFARHVHRHERLAWADVRERLEGRPDRIRSLGEMERTGGEPDVVGRDRATGEYLFVDCAPESPAGRRSVCYDREAREARKEHPPRSSALEMASEMGASLLTEAQYRELQELGEFDTRTSSWLFTPPSIRRLGGALFGDRRYGAVFLYHNGAESYYAARGFRCLLRV